MFSSRTLVAVLVTILSATPATAQNTPYPTRPITIVIPFAPGGGTETETRLYAQRITETEGYTLLVENRSGAAGTIGTAYVAKTAPDGYTVLQIVAGHTIAPVNYPNLPYDPVKDFAPIALMSKRPYIFMAHPSLPVTSLVDYITYARAHPGAINYATGGPGGSTHLAGAWLHHATKSEVTFVHYKSTGAFTADLTAGRVQVTATTPINALAYITSGKLRGLAVTINNRMPLLPDLPTVIEQGVPGYDYSSWMGFLAPAGTPLAVINKLNADFVKASRTPGIADKLKNDGIVLIGSTPEQFRQFLIAEVARWAALIRETGLRMVE